MKAVNFMSFKEIFRDKAELLKTLGHPVRLCIVAGLMENECNVKTIQECLELPQSTISQHLAILKARGILEGTRKGLEVCYKVINEDAKKIINSILGEEEKSYLKEKRKKL